MVFSHMPLQVIISGKLCWAFWALDFIQIMLRLNMSFKLIFASCGELTHLTLHVGSFMLGFDMPCQISLCRKSGIAIIASESHFVGLHTMKVGDKLMNFRN